MNVVNFMEFAKIYRDDLPEMERLKAEMDIWGTYWLQNLAANCPTIFLQPQKKQ